jgi:methanogenic corrinoid protein MtbC1
MPEAIRPDRQYLAEEPRERVERRRAFLTAAIESEIIPQLASGLRGIPRDAADRKTRKTRSRAPFDRAAIERFARLVLSADIGAARAHVGALLQAGIEIESVYLSLLTPAARQLGVMWETDACTFVDVTVGLARIHTLMRDHLPGFHRNGTDEANGFSVLLTPAADEQHTFGLAMVAEFFRRSGWDVESNVAVSDRELARIVAGRSISLIGFSASCTDRLDALAETIDVARRNSRNPAIGVIVGGNAFLRDPRLVARIGADAMVSDAQQAPLQAQLLASRLQQQERR